MVFEFDGVDLSQYFRIKRIHRSLLPHIENKVISIPGLTGNKYAKDKIGIGVINLSLRIKDLEKMEEIAGVLRTEFPSVLRLPDKEGKHSLAKVDGDTPLSENPAVKDVEVRFICIDPCLYADDKVTSDISKKVVAYGTEKTRGTIHADVTNTSNHIEIKLKSTGEFLRIEDSFTAGDKIVIDLEEEYITKNGYSAMKFLTLESDFFNLYPGENEFILSNLTGNIEFRERWL